jgi:hypothetical protein
VYIHTAHSLWFCLGAVVVKVSVPVSAPNAVEFTGIERVFASITVAVKVPLTGVQLPVAPEIVT